MSTDDKYDFKKMNLIFKLKQFWYNSFEGSKKSKIIAVVCAAQLTACNPFGQSSVDSTFSTANSDGGVTTASSSCVAGTAIAGNVLSGVTFPDGIGGLTTGTMNNRGTWNISTTSFPGDGFFAGITGAPALSSICSTATFQGASGTANCTSSIPALGVSGSLSWGTIGAPTEKSLTFSIGSTGANFAKLAFSGTGLDGFQITSVAGATMATTPSAASNVIVGVVDPGQTSTTVKIKPVYVGGAAKTMTVTVTDANATSTVINADVTAAAPIPAISGLLAWYSAETIGQADGSSIASWPDSSGNSNNATQSTAAARPTYAATGINGQPAVRFSAADGTEDFLSFASALTTVRTAFFVIMHATGSQDYAFILGNDGGSASHGGGGGSLFYYNFAYSLANNNGIATAPLSFSKSATPNPQLVAITYSSNLASTAYISKGNVAGRYWNGWISEIVLYDSAITLAEFKSVERYLAGKYGITLPVGY